ncbi:hypothetical protein SAMN04488688_102525 [Paenibacillus sp. cl141a]|nr:hypothetical protein SAMN04488688_102525 [Paenibacillus sp. cl141a]
MKSQPANRVVALFPVSPFAGWLFNKIGIYVNELLKRQTHRAMIASEHMTVDLGILQLFG